MHNTNLPWFSHLKEVWRNAIKVEQNSIFGTIQKYGTWHLEFMASSRTIPRTLVDGIDTSSAFPISKM